jgi:hypothetical protein
MMRSALPLVRGVYGLVLMCVGWFRKSRFIGRAQLSLSACPDPTGSLQLSRNAPLKLAFYCAWTTSAADHASGSQSGKFVFGGGLSALTAQFALSLKRAPVSRSL